MTRAHSLRAAAGNQGWPRIAATALAAMVAGCSGAAARVHLPARPSAARPTPVSTPASSATRQVIAAFTGYTIALGQADKSRNATLAGSLLRPYLVAGRINGLVEAMSSIWVKGEVFYGQDVLHISAVTVSGGQAFVHDCDDTSGMGLAYAATGQTVPGSTGVSRENLITRLDLVGGRWLVEFQLIEDLPCSA